MSTTTDSLELVDQATGENDGTWGDVADTNFQYLELAIAKRLSLSTTGGTTTLSSSQNRYPIIVVTGTLASNAVIEVKAQQKNWIFINNTTGDYTVQVKTASGTGKIIPRRRGTKLYCDGTDVQLVRAPTLPQAIAGGTADAITATFYPEIVAADLTDDFLCVVECTDNNTITNPTFNPNGIASKTIYRHNGAALKVGDIRGPGFRALLSFSTAEDGFILLNPAVNDHLLGEGSDITDDATITIPRNNGYFKLTTSTVAITAFSCTNAFAGRRFVVEFDTARTLTHDATALILPGGRNITTAQGDKAEFEFTGTSSNVRCLWYTKANGKGVTQSWEYLDSVDASSSASIDITGLANYRAVRVTMYGVNLASATRLLLQLYNGSSYVTSSYGGNITESSSSTVSTNSSLSSGGVIQDTVAAGGGNISGVLVALGMQSTGKKTIIGQLQYTTGGTVERAVTVANYNNNASTMSGLRLIAQTGNITSGTFIFEGLR
jgi:hypothetical protein